MAENRVHHEDQGMIEKLKRQLNEALTRVDRLSADLVQLRSLRDVQLLPYSYHSPCQPASPRPSVRPPQFQLGDETMADTTRSAGYSDQSQHSDHSGHHRSESCSSIGSRRSRSPGASDDAAPPKAGSVRQEEIISGVFDVQIKPRDPPTFSGRTQEDPEMWVGQMSNFFRLVGGPPQKQVAYASTLLQGTAQAWWQRKVMAREDPTDWESFAKQLIGRFQNTNRADFAMATLMNIKQRKEESTHDFISRFEAELDKVDSYNESWVLRMFIWGLPQDQAMLVSQGKPAGLSQAFQLAKDMALAAQMARRPGTSGNTEGNRSQKGQGRGQGKFSGQHSGTGKDSAPDRRYKAQGYNVQHGGRNRGRGQAGRPHVPPQPSVVVRQPAQQQASGPGQRGRRQGNQRRPRAVVIAAQVDHGDGWSAGPGGCSARSRDRNRCFLASGARKLTGSHSGQSGDYRWDQGQVIQRTCTLQNTKLSSAKRRRQRRKWQWKQRLERRRRRRELRAEQKQDSSEDTREMALKSQALLGETPKVSVQRTESAPVADAVGSPAPGTGVKDHVLLVVKAAVNGTSVPALIDSGASRSFVSDQLRCHQPMQFVGAYSALELANGETIVSTGIAPRVLVCIGKVPCRLALTAVPMMEGSGLYWARIGWIL